MQQRIIVMSCASFLVRNSQAWHPRLPCSLCVDQSTQRPDCRRSQPIVLGSPTSVTEFLDVDRVPHLWPLSGKACAFQYAIIGKGFRGRSSDSGQPVSDLPAICPQRAVIPPTSDDEERSTGAPRVALCSQGTSRGCLSDGITRLYSG